MNTDTDFDGLRGYGRCAELQNQEMEERMRIIHLALEECRVSVGGPRGNRIAAILYHELRLPDPQQKVKHERF